METAWTTLRNRYATEKRKRNNNPSSLATVPEWRYFEDLSFLDPYIVPRKYILYYLIIYKSLNLKILDPLAPFLIRRKEHYQILIL